MSQKPALQEAEASSKDQSAILVAFPSSVPIWLSGSCLVSLILMLPAFKLSHTTAPLIPSIGLALLCGAKLLKTTAIDDDTKRFQMLVACNHLLVCFSIVVNAPEQLIVELCLGSLVITQIMAIALFRKTPYQESAGTGAFFSFLAIACVMAVGFWDEIESSMRNV